MAFAKLKELGFACEFITEQARLYIAKKRYILNEKPSDNIELTDDDQMRIMLNQIDTEKMVAKAVGDDVVVISDSSPLNSILYMSEAFRQEVFVKEAVAEVKTDIVFYCAPVATYAQYDPNRVHSHDVSLTIDSQIPTVMNQFAPEVWSKVVHLTGDPNARMHKVVNAILTR